ncbi:MAG: outer membrane protein assembly factor BamA [bacterium]|nr:MAG: outer membrane protein assembly factor BamA [bacterium]
MIHARFILLFCVVLLAGAVRAATEEPRTRQKIKSVVIEGNEAFSDRRLKRLMLTRPHRFYSRSYYYPEVLQDDIRNLVLFYQLNGYLEAAVSDYIVDVDSIKNQARIEITLVEGEQTFIEGIGIFGAAAFSDSLILERIGVRKGDPFRRKKIQDGVLSILSLYADHGYFDAEVIPDIRINSETHRALVDINIKEKWQSRVADIRIEGLEKTRDRIVTRELSFRHGEVARYSRLLESQRLLYLTGLFQSVFIRPVSTAERDSMVKDILIDLKENESLEMNFYVGYGSVERGRARIELFNNNVAGSARKLGVAPYVSFISYGVETSFSEPRTFGLRWRTDLNMIYGYREEPTYDIERIGGRIVLGRTFIRRSTISLAYRYEKSDLSNVKVIINAGELENDIRSLKLALIFDTRDNLFNAQQGLYMEWSNELAGSFLQGSEDFYKLLWRFKYHHPVGQSTVLACALETGWTDYFGQSTEVPLNERFYLGGPNVLRGFDYRMVGPLDDKGEPLGGNFVIAVNLLEIRRVIYKMFGGVLFVDVGNVWEGIDNFDISDIRSAAGIGLRANTPIGIVRCDYGFNLDPQESEPSGKLYFSVGQAF